MSVLCQMDDAYAAVGLGSEAPSGRVLIGFPASTSRILTVPLMAHGAAEMARVLHDINARIQFVRWIDLADVTRKATHRDHKAVVKALRERNADACTQLLRKRISCGEDAIVDATHKGLAQIFTARR
jgi:hypothetical protein